MIQGVDWHVCWMDVGVGVGFLHSKEMAWKLAS